MIWLLPMGIAAGILSTVTGVGGGLLITLSLVVLWGPERALGTTAPVLFLGNVQRTLIFRDGLRLTKNADGVPAYRRILPMTASAALGALTLGFVAGYLPLWVIHACIVSAPLLSIAKTQGWIRLTPRKEFNLAASVGAGGLTAAGGSGGLIMAPLLLANGFTDRDYIAGLSLTAASIHVARLMGYGASGWLESVRIIDFAFLLVGVLLGNFLGSKVRNRLTERTKIRLAHGALVLSAVLAVLGI